MFLLSGIALFLDGGRKGHEWSWGGGQAGHEFPSGRLTSAAWEGWWHEDPAGPTAEGDRAA